jgi:hypothetical protein
MTRSLAYEPTSGLEPLTLYYQSRRVMFVAMHGIASAGYNFSTGEHPLRCLGLSGGT